MATEIEFKTKVAKYRRINIPKTLFQVETGDEVIVRIEKIESAKKSD